MQYLKRKNPLLRYYLKFICANSCNRKLYTLVSSPEFESVEKWFTGVAEKADDAIAKALAHLEEREGEPPSTLGPIAPRPQSMLSSASNKSAQVSEARRKAHIAKLKAKQIEEEALRRKQLEIIEEQCQREIDRVKREQERVAKEETERRRIQECKDLAAQAELEADLIEAGSNEVYPENLKERLKDFDNEPRQTANAVENTPQGKPTDFFHETQNENIPTNTYEIIDKTQNRTNSWIADLPPATELVVPTNIPYSPQSPIHRNSVPKLTLTKFDGDPLKWTD